MLARLIIAILCVFCLAAVAFGQPISGPLVRSWHTEDGLPSDAVNCVAQAPDGFLWIGTDEGIARFDGTHFVTFAAPEGLPTLRVTSIAIEPDGTVWASLYGLGVVRIRDGVVKCYTPHDGLPAHDERVAVDTDGAVWAVAENGLVRWDSGHFAKVPDPPEHGVVRDPLALHSGGLLCTFINGNPAILKNGVWSNLEPPIPPELGHALRFAEDSAGHLWAITERHTVLRLEAGAWRVIPFANEPDASVLRLIAAGPGGEVAVVCQSGAAWEFKDGEFVPLIPFDPSWELPEAAFYDRDGQLWIGAFSSGLVRVSPRRVETILVSPEGGAPSSICSILERKPGVYWLGANGGGAWQWANRSMSRLNSPPEAAAAYTLAMLRARDGAAYIGSDLGVAQIREGGAGIRIPLPGFEGGDYIDALAEDAAGNVWAGAGSGKLYRIRDARAELMNAGSRAGAIRAIETTPDGALWYATLHEGVHRIMGGKTTVFGMADGLRVAHINALYCDASGTLWAGTFGGGLARFKAGWFESLGTEAGINDDTITQIIDDPAGRLWLGGPRGLCAVSITDIDAVLEKRADRVDPSLFNRSEGMISTDFSLMRPIRDSEGFLCFGTRSGLVRVDLARLNVPHQGLRVFIQEFNVDGKSLAVPPGTAWPAEMDLGLGVTRLEIGFTAPDLRLPEYTPRFRWRLIGGDERWHDAGSERRVLLERLPPRSYRFEVIASLPDGTWTAPASLGFILRSYHYWQTWWFMALCVLAALLAAAAIARSVILRRAERARVIVERTRAVQAERTRIAREMHDEIGSNIAALDMLSGYILKGEIDERARNDVADMGRIARETTDSLHEVLWLMGERGDLGIDLADQLAVAATRMLHGVDVRWSERLSHFPDPIGQAARRQIFLFFKEALANVIKHSGAGIVTLASSFHNGEYRLVIADDGCGFDAGKAEKGIGLANLSARAESAGGRAVIESAPGGGTSVTLVVPVSSA